ncbi:phosphoenolpyruvate--protein phosphotransferase [Frateuria aurantia]
MRLQLQGTCAAPGMTLGRARLVAATQHAVDHRPLGRHEIESELTRLHQALEIARQELQDFRGRLQGVLATEVNEFIDAHCLMLSDGELLRGLDELIRVGHYRADAALKKQRDRLAGIFDAMNDPYMRSRREDIDQVFGRVMSALQRQTTPAERQLAASVGEILVADMVAPSDMAQLAESGLLGVVAAAGSTYSHGAILARSLNLPMLVGTLDALSSIHDDDLILLDAEQGLAIVHPSAGDLAHYRSWQRSQLSRGRKLAALAQAPSRTADGADIRLYANAELGDDVARARRDGADGVGLYRTEFLFLRHRQLPSEEEQFTAYRDVVLGMGGAPVTIRTLDLGADKADAAGFLVRREENPALGMRGVRLALQFPAVFNTQIRAILRAACYGPVRVLVPMVTQSDELIAVRALFSMAREELKREGIDLPERLPLGAMIEVPAAAINVRALLDHADFLAIGSNDLTQYVLAADRGNDALGNLYTPLQPALLRLLAFILHACRKTGKPVSLCGEIGGDVHFTALLLALGLTEFSMHPSQLLPVRERLAQLDRSVLLRQAPRLLRAYTYEDVEQVLATMTEAAMRPHSPTEAPAA